MNERWKLWLAWTGGILGLFAIEVILSSIATGLGFPTWIDYGETLTFDHGRWEEERDGQSTAIGWWIHGVSFVFGLRIGMAIYQGSLNGGVSRNGNMQAVVFLPTLTVYAFATTLIWLIFGRVLRGFPGFISLASEGCVIALTIWLTSKVSKAKGISWR